VLTEWIDVIEAELRDTLKKLRVTRELAEKAMCFDDGLTVEGMYNIRTDALEAILKVLSDG